MEAIEAVFALAKQRDEIAEELDVYESWFEGLVGEEVTLMVTVKKRTRYVPCRVTEFTQGEGWELTSIEAPDGDPDVFHVTFSDFLEGRVYKKN
jgi:hypothetical protein